MTETQIGASAESHRSIPSLDGLRAFAVLAVILDHSKTPLLRYVPFLRSGGQGVAVFFVLSGFLITHLLLKELNRTSTVNLKKFYFRRTFRIFPPFYVFLAVVAVLMVTVHLPVTWSYIAAAATYTWNYVPLPENWPLGHCWSLSLEEQFYLLWPASMVFFSKRTNFRIAAGVILLSPISRVVTYYAWPSMRYHIDMMLHTHLDTIMMGCLLALALDLHVGKRGDCTCHALVGADGGGAVSVVCGHAGDRALEGDVPDDVGFSLENVAIAVIVLYSVFRYDSPLGRLLNLRAVKHVGMISYSIYLWQQLFTLQNTWHFPANILVIFVIAEASYWLVERPSFAMRDWLGARWFPKSFREAPVEQALSPGLS